MHAMHLFNTMSLLGLIFKVQMPIDLCPSVQTADLAIWTRSGSWRTSVYGSFLYPSVLFTGHLAGSRRMREDEGRDLF